MLKIICALTRRCSVQYLVMKDHAGQEGQEHTPRCRPTTLRACLRTSQILTSSQNQRGPSQSTQTVLEYIVWMVLHRIGQPLIASHTCKSIYMSTSMGLTWLVGLNHRIILLHPLFLLPGSHGVFPMQPIGYPAGNCGNVCHMRSSAEKQRFEQFCGCCCTGWGRFGGRFETNATQSKRNYPRIGEVHSSKFGEFLIFGKQANVNIQFAMVSLPN